MTTMDYNGKSNETEIKARIHTFVGFANTIYWQQPNNTVINVVNGKTKEIYRKISLFTQWTNLTNLVVMDTFHQPTGENLSLPNNPNFYGFINICEHANVRKQHNS